MTEHAPERPPPTRRRVLVIVQGDLGDRPLGPEIRGTEIARAFARRHDVTIAATTGAPFVHDGLRVVPRTRRSLAREVCRHDVVIGPVLPPYLVSLASARRCLRVSDLYDPVDLEVATVEQSGRAVRSQRMIRRLQLRWSDIVVSANRRQEDRARADLATLAARAGGPRLITVPMGLADPPPAGSGHPLRDALGISYDDPVVLWWGTAWRWLDAAGAVRAIAGLVPRRPDVRLVVTAGKPRNPRSAPLNATEPARDLARSLGLLDRNVFFLDDWVTLAERASYLADADLGITLNMAGPEAHLAARTRYMDYLWASLPSVLTAGDELADEMARAGAARLVAARDDAGVAAAIEELLASPRAAQRARAGCATVADRYRWSAVVRPLVDAVDAWPLGDRSARDVAATVLDGGRYYAHRARDTLLEARLRA